MNEMFRCYIQQFQCKTAGNVLISTHRFMQRATQLIVFAAILFASSVQAQPADSLLLQAKEMLRAGAMESNTDKIQQARVMFERATSDDQLATLGHYYAAYAAHQLVGLLSGGDSDTSSRELLTHIDYAIQHLEVASQRDPSFAEGWALLASVYGRKISLRPLSGMTLGPKSSRAQKTAQELAPNNPRVVLLKAVGDYNTPRMWGGDKERAIEGFHQAAALYQNEVVSDPLQPSWGHIEVYAWLGIAYMDEDNLPEARKALEKALEIDPEFGWVKYGLMPSLAQRERDESN